jgi:hypothetical protein
MAVLKLKKGNVKRWIIRHVILDSGAMWGIVRKITLKKSLNILGGKK